MKRIKIGDLIEIQTKRGLAYAQYTHKHQRYGSLIRVYSGFDTVRPNDLQEIVRRDVQFSTFIPLQAAVNLGIFEVVGNVDVPEPLQRFPIFRTAAYNSKLKVYSPWWLWDGEKEWEVGQLKPEEWQYPTRGIINDTMLIKRIEDEWKSSDVGR